jgi:osmotically-inducible protein OsmY
MNRLNGLLACACGACIASAGAAAMAQPSPSSGAPGADSSADAPSPNAASAAHESTVRSLQNDDALLERVANALANDPELGDADITVFVADGRVALEGRTRNAGQAVRAVAVTRRAAGSGVDVRSELRAAHPRDAAAA